MSQKIKIFLKFVRIIESFVLVSGLISIVFSLYGYLRCDPAAEFSSNFCQEWGIGKPSSIWAVLVLIPLYGIINSIHIGIILKYKTMGKTDILYFVGLFGLAMSFICYSILRNLELVQNAATANIMRLLVYLITGTTTTIFLFDTKFWNQISLFIKVRLLTSILYVVATTVSPLYGIGLGLIIIPVNLLFSSNTED